MNHNGARLLIGAEPHCVPGELAEHLASCPECAQFQRETLALDNNIRRALEQGPLTTALPAASVIPIGQARGSRRQKRATAWSGWALAASVALVSILVVWALRPSDTLAREIVAHVESESISWTGREAVTAADIEDALSRARIALDMSSDRVMYAHSCWFRGHLVPHLVVHMPQGPITVIVLPYDTVKHQTSFHEDGMTGVITPAPRGSIAVLAQGDGNIEAVAQQVRQSVRWLP
jgi:hypothetical protein